MFPRCLGGIHQVPALLQGGGGGNFHGRMFAILHRIERHRDMPVPWSRNVNDIEFELGQISEVLIAFGECCRLGLASIGDHLLRMSHLFGDEVTDRLHINTVDREKIAEQTRAATSDSNDSQTHSFVGFKGNADHSGARTFRCSREEIVFQNVIRDDKSRTTHRGANQETTPRNAPITLILTHGPSPPHDSSPSRKHLLPHCEKNPPPEPNANQASDYEEPVEDATR